MNIEEVLKDKHLENVIKSINREIMFIALVGSHGQKLDNKKSDIDIVIVIANTIDELLGIEHLNCSMPSIVNTHCNIISFNDLVQNLVYGIFEDIELIGLSNEFYSNISATGKLFLDNRKLFISKQIITSANKHALKQIDWINKSIDNDNKSKSMLHLIRTYITTLNILNNKFIWTTLDDFNDIDLLLSVKQGNYIDSNNNIKDNFWLLLDNYKNKINELIKISEIPDNIDLQKINQLVININKISINEVK